ncbi:MAG TPA: hypothetical protein VF451_02045, partial [Acidobacteriota bacterium]
RQGDPREIEAHFHKAAQYLEKKEIAGDELAGFITFCGRMYKFIAVKVRFSARLGSLLREEDGDEEIRRQAAGLKRQALDLKNLYVDSWNRHVQPGSRPPDIKGFDFLCESFARLIRTVSRPAGREDLMAELKKYSPLNVMDGELGDDFYRP